MSMRRCEIVQQADRLTEEQIIEGLKNRRSIKWYAYVLHDSDTYTKEDEASNPEHKQGEPKPPHWHIVIFLLFPDSSPLWLGSYLHGGTENLKKAQTFSS